ncbi:Chloride channel protein CLC-d, partial [Cucurbita argyrosperma subsp. sororia]
MNMRTTMLVSGRKMMDYAYWDDQIFGSIGSVGGGLALGKEGPLVHTGACIASLLGQGGSGKYHLNSRWLRAFKSDRDRRDLVS